MPGNNCSPAASTSQNPKSSQLPFPSVKAMARMKPLSPPWAQFEAQEHPTPQLTYPHRRPEEPQPLAPGAGPQLGSLRPGHRPPVRLPSGPRKDAEVSSMLKGSHPPPPCV